MHNHLPRYVLRVLSWVGLVYLRRMFSATLARRGTDVTLIASPEDAENFTAKGGRAALDRLQWTSQPPRPDHHAHRRSFRPSPGGIGGDPATQLQVAAVSPSEHIPVSDITSIESRRIR